MLLTVPQYVNALNDTYGLTRTLGVIDVLRDADGCPQFTVGNNSVLFTVRRDGRSKMLKCYTRPKRNLRRIYGSECLHDELFIHNGPCSGEWVDIVLYDRIEGRSLRRAIADSLGDGEAAGRLAREFDRFALDLLRQEWAHGDLKPENIIVDDDGHMHPIDFDAMFRPEFAGERSDETGTAAFQHPLRSAELFDKSIDDYPIALISTALHALSADPELYLRYPTDEELLADPREIYGGRSRALEEILRLFAKKCMAVQYRTATLLRSPSPRLFGLEELLACRFGTAAAEARTPELAEKNGLWGYTLDRKFVIPPVYDCGFEFSEGMAAVRIADSLHFIYADGSPALDCDGCSAVKPFRNGHSVVIRDGCRFEKDRDGNETPADIGTAADLNIRSK